MKINNEWLKKRKACLKGIEWFNEHNFKTDIELLKVLMKHNLNWVDWTITKLFNKKQRIQYSVYVAKQVLPIFEKEYPDDKRPREAIEAAIKYVDNNTKENKNVARSAAWSARSAWSAWSAENAGSAAWRAKKGMQKKILNYGIKLLKKEE